MDAAGLRAEKENVGSEIEGLKEKMREDGKRLGEVRAGLEKTRKRLEALERKEVEWRRLSEELAGKKRALALVSAGIEAGASEEKRMEAQAALETALRALGEKNSLLREAEGKICEASKTLGGMEQAEKELEKKSFEKKELEKKRKMLPLSLKELQAEKEKAAERAEQSRAFISVQKAEMMKVKHAIQELEREVSACPVCGTPLQRQKRLALLQEKREHEMGLARVISDKEAELALQKKEAENAGKNYALVEEIEERLNVLKNAEKELAGLLEEKKGLERWLEETVGKKAALEREVEVKRKAALEKERRLREIERALEEKRKAEELKAEIRKIEETMRLEKFDEREVALAREESRRGEVEAEKLKAEIEGARKLAEEKNRLFESLKKRLGDVEKVSERLGSMIAAGELLAVWENALVETQAALRENYVKEISQALELVWPVVYPYKDFSSARLNASAEDYSLELKAAQGGWIQVEGRTSGGERACAALALRIAFATVLVPNLSWLFLDEPTHNLDSEAVAALAKALRDEVPKIVGQTIVITHDEHLKKAASGKTYVFAREKAGGKTVVEEAAVEEAGE